ncbi:unnamed protein product, partial [Rotaria magnacalcarata]
MQANKATLFPVSQTCPVLDIVG